MSQEGVYGELVSFDCSSVLGDGLDVQRVGHIGSDLSVVAVTAFVQEAELEDLGDGVFVTRAPVMLLPEHARMLAAALIDAADEADGLETSLLGEQMGELSE